MKDDTIAETHTMTIKAMPSLFFSFYKKTKGRVGNEKTDSQVGERISHT